MDRKSATDDVVLPETMTQDEWQAQDPCPECGGRPGENPATGVRLRIMLPNHEWCEGHTYNCSKRPQ